MKRNITRILLLMLLLAANYCLQAQTIRYAKPGGAGNGSSWTTASGDLQGIINASAPGDEVWVAKGTYLPTRDEYNSLTPVDNRKKIFAMKSGVGIYGGFSGTEAILAERVLKNNPTVLSGDLGTTGDNSDNSYHVIYNDANNLTSTARLDGFTITGGNASGSSNIDQRGGGVNNYSAGSPLFANCTFTGNGTSGGGGAMVNQNSSPTLIDCIFINNTGGYAAGILNFVSSSPTLTNCSFWGNTGGRLGTAIQNEASSGSSSTLVNCIIWGNSSGIYGPATVTYSIVQDGGYIGTGNLDQDPLFADAANGDLHLQPCSPAIDAGSDAANSTTQDLDGNPGKVRTIDMGAYEYQGTPATPPSITDELMAAQTLCQNGTAATLSVTATGDALSYQWYSNTANSNTGGTAISNATASTYTPSTTAAGTMYYYVVVSGTCSPAATSQVATVTVSASPGRLYVNTSATGANTGLSWQDAFTDLQNALTYSCSGSLTEIWVAAGTYKPTIGADRNASFIMKNGVAIYGGFAGGETSLSQRNLKTNVTIFSGDIGTAGDNVDNAIHVVTGNNLNNTAVLDGFTITGGNASVGRDADSWGGGMLLLRSFPTIANCIFSGNYASNNGGGIYNSGTAANTSSFPTLTNCSFSGNTATNGGGMYNYSSSPTLTNCILSGNSANLGGAIFNYTSGSPVLVNCTFSGNTATSGGGIYNLYYSEPTITACIFWGDTGGEIDDDFDAYSRISYSLVQAGCPVDAGCTSVSGQDPLFVSTTDLHLQPCSPAIDAGSDATNSTSTDLDGAGRKVDAITGGTLIDIGAYEYQQVLPTYYEDKDGDGFGNPGVSQQACSQPQNYVADNTDCNDIQVLYQDNDGDGFGSNVKVACSGVTNNTDCDDTKTTYQDNDGDGFGTTTKVACGGVTNSSDCDDNNTAINPATIWVLDADGDGYYSGSPLTQCGSPGTGYVIKTTQQAGDCLDNNAAVHPGAIEICSNGIDDNCNGQVDEGCTLAPLTITIQPSSSLEGNSDKHYMYFTLQLNYAAPTTCEVTYETRNGTANAGSDYQKTEKEVKFLKGESSKKVGVYIYGDRKAEPDETFTVGLEHPEHVKIAVGKAVGTIINDDGKICNTNEAVMTAAKPEEETISNNLKIYPNPTSGPITIELRTGAMDGTTRLELLDLSGRTLLIETASVVKGTLRKQLQIPATAAAGVYLLRIVAGSSIYQAKLVYAKP